MGELLEMRRRRRSVIERMMSRMTLRDLLKLSGGSILRSRLRSSMLLLAMAIGVASVVVLTALGEGARNYVTGEFKALGTRLIIVFPGRSETSGIQPGMFSGETPRDLTLGDAQALLRLPDVEGVVPLMVGSATASANSRERDVPVLGANATFQGIQSLTMAQGTFLPATEIDRDSAVAVIGAVVQRELFPNGSALGQTLKLGDRRFRVIGVMSSSGRSIGFDTGEMVVVPVTAAQTLFNNESLFRIMVQLRDRESMARVRQQVIDSIKARHQGEADVTVVTQDALLATFDKIFTALTLTLAGIASISLAVAGVLVMNVMLVAVSQRTAEVGLLKAIGATQRQVIALFLAEAILLSVMGAAIGVAVGEGATWFVRQLYPSFPLRPPLWALVMGVLIAVGSGVVFGLLPARRAARLDPVEALAGKR